MATRIIARCFNEEQINLIKKDFEDYNVVFKEPKKNIKNDNDKTNYYNFKILDYDNTNGKYELCYTAEIKYNKDLNNIFQISKQKYKNAKVSKSKNSVSITFEGYEKPNEKLEYVNINNDNNNTTYPINVLSYGRYEKLKTCKYLVKSKINFYLWIEPCEYDLYIEHINRIFNNEEQKYITVMKSEYDYHLYNNGGTPMRNNILNYWNEKKIKRAWLLDDNINVYYRIHNGCKNKIYSSLVFKSVENYIENIEEYVGICSHNIGALVRQGYPRPVITEDTKHYSSLLLLTDNKFRFKHKYNEDIFISIDYLNSGLLNFCFTNNVFDKNTSGKDKGGNTNTIYKDGTNQGYLDKYNYLYNNLLQMLQLNLLSLIDNKTIDDLCKIKYRQSDNAPTHILNLDLIKKNKIIKIEEIKDKIKTENLDYLLKLV